MCMFVYKTDTHSAITWGRLFYKASIVISFYTDNLISGEKRIQAKVFRLCV